MNSNSTTWAQSSEEYQLSRFLRFWLFLIFTIPSLMCTVFILYHLLKNKTSRNSLQNQVVIVLLSLTFIYEAIDVPLHLNYLAIGHVRPAQPSLCLVWWFIDCGFYYTIAILVMLTSFERHLSIFHVSLYANQRKRILLHYLPMSLTAGSVLLFYAVIIFIPVCKNQYDYTQDLCGSAPCYQSISSLVFIEQVILSATCSFLIAIFSLALLARVLYQKYHIGRAITWRNQRKLIVQTVSFASIYLIVSLPLSIVYLIRLYFDSKWGERFLSEAFFFTYFLILLLPYIFLINVPNLREKLKFLKVQRKCTVAPT